MSKHEEELKRIKLKNIKMEMESLAFRLNLLDEDDPKRKEIKERQMKLEKEWREIKFS